MRILNIRCSLDSSGVLMNRLFLAAFLFVVAAIASIASAQVVLSVAIAPPPLPVYTQPVCPGDGYIWTPGYWSYSDDGGYFWVPGTWVEAPEVGLLWTPGYWGWSDGVYAWNEGYWGPQVGFYGGVDYGFGYIGVGYAGGYWNSGHFFYNSRVNNVNVTVVHNVYQKTVVEHVNHVSFNGGHGGIRARPTAEQERFAHEHHVPAAAVQREHETAARSDHNQFNSVNHGHPGVAATAKPGEFKGSGVVGARGSTSNHVATKSVRTRSEAKPHAESKARAEGKPATHEAKPAAKSRAEGTRTESKARTEEKPATHEAKPATKSRAEGTRTESKARTEEKPATHEAKPAAKSRAEGTRTETKARSEAKPSTHESKPAAKPRAESAPRTESKPRTEAKPAPRAESKPAATHESKEPAQHSAKPPAEHASKPPAEHAAKPPAEHESAPREKKPPKS